VHNLRILQTRFYEQGSTNKNNLQASKPLQPYFKSRKGISQTSLHRSILNKICRRIFFLRVAQCKKTKNYVQGQLFNVPQQRFFWFTSSGFLKRPVLLKFWLLRPFFYKEATCKSSTIKGLLYAVKAVPSKDYIMHLTLKNARKGH
jgi:hypothetical protein